MSVKKLLKQALRKLYYLNSFLKFKKCGKNIILSKGGTITRANEISLGSNVFINRNFHISARNLVIKSNVMIGPNLVIECDNHTFDKIGTTMFDQREERNIEGVVIEDDVWIGANVTILSGAHISEGCIVGACSLVNKYIPPYTIAFGTPAKAYKARFSKEDLKKHLRLINSNIGYESIINIWQNNQII